MFLVYIYSRCQVFILLHIFLYIKISDVIFPTIIWLSLNFFEWLSWHFCTDHASYSCFSLLLWSWQPSALQVQLVSGLIWPWLTSHLFYFDLGLCCLTREDPDGHSPLVLISPHVLIEAFRFSIDSRRPQTFSGVNPFLQTTRVEWGKNCPDVQSWYRLIHTDSWL